jgi:hypothetical protein
MLTVVAQIDQLDSVADRFTEGLHHPCCKPLSNQ